ncbi:MAG: hypothetical protein ACR2OZ_17355 [Verrucomicrobiales bacterium]
MSSNELWRGLNAEARAQLETRNYLERPLVERLGSTGVEAAKLTGGPSSELAEGWIPGVEIFKRQVWQQSHRGWFAELGRQNDPGSIFTRIQMWPRQWATALMFAGTAKGFHIHPPYIAEQTSPEAWIRRLFLDEPQNYSLRPYDREQWDAMFFTRGTAEMLLVDERRGLPRRKMRFLIEGDNRPGESNVGVIIPPGVAHAIRCASSEDLFMVYGTSTQFVPENEGRIASDVEETPLPAPWMDLF